MRDNKVFGILEEVYSRKKYMGKGGGFGKCKRISKWVWKKNEYRS